MSTVEEREDLFAEATVVLDWRFEELLRAGYTAEQAWRLATDRDVDIRVAERLLASGCPRDTAERILL